MGPRVRSRTRETTTGRLHHRRLSIRTDPIGRTTVAAQDWNGPLSATLVGSQLFVELAVSDRAYQVERRDEPEKTASLRHEETVHPAVHHHLRNLAHGLIA